MSVYGEDNGDVASRSTRSRSTAGSSSGARKRKASPSQDGLRRSRRHLSISDDDPTIEVEPEEEALQLADPVGGELRVKKRRIMSPTMDEEAVTKRQPVTFSAPRRTNAIPSTSAESSNGDRRSSDTPSLLSDKNTAELDPSESSSLSSLSDDSGDEA